MLCFWLPLSTASTLAPSAIVIGGSSGMGKAAAIAVASRGGSVLLASRTQAKLDSAADEIRREVPDAELTTRVLDARDEAAVRAFGEELERSADRWDALICTAAGRAPHGPIGELDTADTAGLFDSKFWTAHNVCKHVAPRLTDGGAVALTAGLLNRRPGMNCSPLAAVNGALEGLTRALALEFGPRLRVNCLSPGFCDTERFDHMPAERKAAMLANTAASLPLRRVGAPSDSMPLPWGSIDRPADQPNLPLTRLRPISGQWARRSTTSSALPSSRASCSTATVATISVSTRMPRLTRCGRVPSRMQAMSSFVPGENRRVEG